MLQAYLNYPNPKIRVHAQMGCGEIGKMQKAGQRHVVINNDSIGKELQKFAAQTYRFGADASLNDMWLSVDFGDSLFEEAVIEHVQRLVSQHYGPFGAIKIDHHC
jgi:hypothetical protein